MHKDEICVPNEVPLYFFCCILCISTAAITTYESIKAHIVIETIVPRKCARAMRHHCSKETAGDKSSRVVVFFFLFFFFFVRLVKYIQSFYTLTHVLYARERVYFSLFIGTAGGHIFFVRLLLLALFFLQKVIRKGRVRTCANIHTHSNVATTLLTFHLSAIIILLKELHIFVHYWLFFCNNSLASTCVVK